MKGGWFIGNFEPTAYRTKNFEVAFAKHKKGDKWDKHYHKLAIEITLVIKGKVKVNEEIITDGDIMIIEPNEVVDPLFIEDTEAVVVKTLSNINDKFVIKR